MNLIGHNYIAKQVLGRLNPLIVAGCHLPDIVPFIKDSAFSFDEIHESPDKVYAYLVKNAPKSADLGLAMMTHSVKYGADRFNRDIDGWLIGDNMLLKKRIGEMIVKSSGLDVEVAQGPRLHNYLWAGLDFYLLDTQPEFVKEVAKCYKAIDTSKTSQLLAEIFAKPYSEVKNNVDQLIGDVTETDITTKEGYINFLRVFTSQLPEKDDMDQEQTKETLDFIEHAFIDRWNPTINHIVGEVQNNINQFIPKSWI